MKRQVENEFESPLFDIIDHVQPWKKNAKCLDIETNIFYSTDKKIEVIAKNICDLCVVKADCLEYALENNETHGIWGGKTERERRRILLTRKISPDSKAN